VKCQHVIGFLDVLFLYFSCSQIWLNPVVANCHFWSNMRKLKEKEKKPESFHILAYLLEFILKIWRFLF